MSVDTISVGLIMEGFRAFLENSTIHGLGYISTTRRLIRLFWILIVFIGFSGAGVLIYQSFKGWSESPVRTTTETQPIDKLTFPKVTVCPPKHTYTDLNYDLMMAQNMTLDSDTRNELVSYAKESLNDQVYDTVINNLNKLEDDDRYYNWYHGYTEISAPIPNFKEYDFQYQVITAAISGNISTQNFGRLFDAELVEKSINYRIDVKPPSKVKLCILK